MSKSQDRSIRLIDATGVALCLVLSGTLYFVGVRPVLDDQLAQRQRTAELREREAKAAELGDTLAERRGTLQQTEHRVASQDLRLTELTRLNQRLAEVTQLADDCALQLDTVQPGTQAPGTHYVTVPIHMSGRGSYTSATAFLSQMHATWRDLAVASLDLRSDPRSTSPAPQFTVDLVWYAAPDQ